MNDVRVKINARSMGTFRLPMNSGKLKYKDFTAREIVNQRIVSVGDPVLTLTTGEKIRVFQGGDRTYLLPEADGIIMKHYKIDEDRRREKASYYRYLDYEQSDFPWEDFSGV